MSKYLPHQLPGAFEERVFIGGNYDLIADLRTIGDFVRQAGFVPILPLDDIDIPQDQIHDWDIRILHSCRYAIFDVSSAAGELMEIERTHDFKVKTLLVFQARGPGEAGPSRVATMLGTCGHRMKGYAKPSDDDLGQAVRDFLLGDEHVELYRQAMRFEFQLAQDLTRVREDGSAWKKYILKGLKGTVTQIHHEFTTSLGAIPRLEFRKTAGEKEVTWMEDRTRSSDQHREGDVVINGGLSPTDRPVDYEFEFEVCEGSLCLTREQMEREYGGDALPYEAISREIINPIEQLEISVEFPKGYAPAAKPAVFDGQERQTEVVRPKRDEFVFDDDANKAVFRVRWPRIFQTYMIYWQC